MVLFLVSKSVLSGGDLQKRLQASGQKKLEIFRALLGKLPKIFRPNFAASYYPPVTYNRVVILYAPMSDVSYCQAQLTRLCYPIFISKQHTSACQWKLTVMV